MFRGMDREHFDGVGFRAVGTATSITMRVTSMASAAAGNYTFSPKVFDAAAPAYSATTQAAYNVVIGGGPIGGGSNDDFNRADSSALGNGWTLAAGGYAIQGGAAVGQTALNLAVQASVQTDSARAVFVRPTSASGFKFGVVVRYQVNSYYVCYRQAGGSSQWKISKVVNGVETVLKAVSVSQAPIAIAFTVSCTASGNVISIGDGSAVKASVVDAALASGAVGIPDGQGRESGLLHRAVERRRPERRSAALARSDSEGLHGTPPRCLRRSTQIRCSRRRRSCHEKASLPTQRRGRGTIPALPSFRARRRATGG